MVDLPPVSSNYICDRLNHTCKISFLKTSFLNSEAPSPAPNLAQTPAPKPAQRTTPLSGGTIELRADEQSFESKEQIVTATGNVRVRFRNALLKADQITIDIQSRKAVATGRVILKRGEQILRGERFDYDFGNDKGQITTASGEVYQPSLAQDADIAAKPPVAGEFPDASLADRLERDQPVSKIERRGVSSGSIGSDQEIEFQPPPPPSGTITRLRYRADKLEFDGKVLSGTGVRVTNDPFSPPELELRADRATFKSIGPGLDQIAADNARITIEQSVNLPLVVAQLAVGKRALDNNTFGIGYDNDERGGLFFERNFKLASNENLEWKLTPQYYVQRVIAKDRLFNLDSLGVKTSLTASLAPGTSFDANAALTSLEPSTLGTNLRSKLALTQDVDLPTGKHKVVAESAYRERVFNGTLGFQDIQSSLGIGITSPKIALGDTGVKFDYSAGFKLLNAGTDRVGIGANDGRVTLGRVQLAANLTKSWRLWEGAGPDPNERATYNYSPIPVIPYLQLNTGLNAKVGSYTNGESQSLYGYSVSLQGQVGHFTAPAFDYTGFNIGYSQGFLSGSSPFLFDRFLDTRVVTAGINQQLFGPLRLGVQTSINVDTSRPIGTDYYLEYSRRSFSIQLRYNPVLQLGSIGFKLNDLDWRGQADPF
jgi:lipopolysaccharide export system protein LptA